MTTGVGEAAPSPYDVAAGHATKSRRRAMGLVAGAVLPAVVAVFVILLLLAGPVVAAPVALALWLVGAALLWRAAPGLVLRRLGAVPADPASHARLHNLTESLCVAAGLPKPALLVVVDDAPNSLSVGLSRRSASLVVTTGLTTLTRLELEAVLAHELAHVRRGDMAVSAVAAVTIGPALRIAPGPARRLAERLLAGSEGAADVAAIGLTRYPPALISALERMRDAAAGDDAVASGTALLWNVPAGGPRRSVPPGEGGGGADPVGARIEALLEV